jgi:hypothetical protein
MTRGQNPNSWNNKPKMGLQRNNINLTPKQWKAVELIGQGNKSEGVRRLIDLAIASPSTEEMQQAIALIQEGISKLENL